MTKIWHDAVYLWCNVVWSTAERLRKFAGKDAFLAHAKISNFAMTISIKEYVIQFKISAENTEQTAANFSNWTTRSSTTQVIYDCKKQVSKHM